MLCTMEHRWQAWIEFEGEMFHVRCFAVTEGYAWSARRTLAALVVNGLVKSMVAWTNLPLSTLVR